jgi:hypothetical protein
MRLNELLLRQRCLFLGSFALLIATTTGCGGKGTVTGKVNLDGKPLPAGRIAFVPSKGVAASGEIKDGQYTVTGVPAGDVKVTVETKSLQDRITALRTTVQNAKAMLPPPGAKLPDEAKAGVESDKQDADKKAQELKELEASYRPVPEKYSKPESTPLTLQVKSGSNPFDANLDSK